MTSVTGMRLGRGPLSVNAVSAIPVPPRTQAEASEGLLAFAAFTPVSSTRSGPATRRHG